MKKMNCKQLGGACDKEFFANSFEEMQTLSQQHGIEMYQQQDAPHLAAMEIIQEKMQNPEEMQRWQEEKRKLFESLPEL